MKRQLLEAKEGIRLSLSTGMLEYGHVDRMTTQHFYKAYPGSKLSLLDVAYEFAVAIYTLTRDDTYMYTYAYQENESWASFDSSVKPNKYYKSEYIFDRECYFRINLRRHDDRALDRAEAVHINDILCFELNEVENGSWENIRIRRIFQNEIDDTVKKIKKARREEGTEAFLLLTDSHYVVNGTWEDTIYCIREVDKQASFDGIIHLGDLTDGMVSRKVNYDYVNTVKKDLFSLGRPFYFVMGNHDTNYFKGNPECFSKEEQYWLYQSDCCDGAVREEHSLYFYKDFDGILVRAVFLHSFDECEQVRYGFSQEEVLWLYNILKTVPENYRVLVFSHVPPLAEIHYWSKDIRNGEKMVEILEDYICQDSGHCVLGWIHGHNHADQIYRKNLFPIVSLGCTKVEDFKDRKPENAVTYDRKVGEVSQELWNVLILQRDKGNIKLIRFGAGEDMQI